MALLRVDPRIKEFEKLKKAATDARAPFDRDAWLNLAFYLDQQYTEWSDSTGSIRRIKRDSKSKNAPRPIVNKIMHFVQQERSMVLQAKPTVDVLPATDDYGDISEAGVGGAYCRSLIEPTAMNFNRQLARAALWSIIAGDGYLKWYYNEKEKRPDVVPCSFFDIYPDPYAQDFGKCHHVIHAQFMSTEQIYEGWGVELKESATERADVEKTELLRGMGSAPVLTGVTVNELWEKPCRRHPNGRYAVWTAKQFLVEPGPLPYDHRRLPFTQIGCIERPDSQHFMSPVTYLRPAQMELNLFHAQKIQIRKNFANPKWWVPLELELEGMPDDSPNQVLRGQSQNGLLRPELIQPAMYQDNGDGSEIETQMMHIVGLHEVSQAQVPGRVEAAKAIEMLKESDADRQAIMLETISATITEGFYQLLMLAKQYVSEEVIVQTYSREGLPEVKRWKTTGIKEGMRVQVTMGTGLARSKAARQDQLMMMWDKGIIRDPALMAELMEVPFPSFAEPRARDLRLARNENLELAKGSPIVPNSWDDHAIHLREHNDYRKTEEFLGLDEDVKVMFEHHCTSHDKMFETQLAKMMQQQVMAQQAAGGGQPQPGQPTDGGQPPS